MNPPLKLLVVSDANQLQFVEVIAANAGKKTEAAYVYEYTVSSTKEGCRLSLPLNQVKALLRSGIMQDIS